MKEALGETFAQVGEVRLLRGNSGEGYALEVAWVAPQPFRYGRGVHPDAAGIRVDIIPVATTLRGDIRSVLRAQALPQLRDWIERALVAPETWQLSDHRRSWAVADGSLTFHDEP
ncbi:hypothetical protein [Streptomyces sp. NPDC059491]|uniref:hypothetical protein n=1 Tax=Streptomyces sp. NPDC059491 TaxID=3346850 RepID=UPI0036A0282A